MYQNLQSRGFSYSSRFRELFVKTKDFEILVTARAKPINKTVNDMPSLTVKGSFPKFVEDFTKLANVFFKNSIQKRFPEEYQKFTASFPKTFPIECF